MLHVKQGTPRDRSSNDGSRSPKKRKKSVLIMRKRSKGGGKGKTKLVKRRSTEKLVILVQRKGTEERRMCRTSKAKKTVIVLTDYSYLNSACFREELTYLRGDGSDVKSPRERSRPVKADKRIQVQLFVETTFRKGVQGLIEEFRSMKRTNNFALMREFLVQNGYGRNRYKDVGCLDNRRVIVTIGPVSYIHANYVATPNNYKRFICTQAPLPNTCSEFWNMVVQEKSASILMLCNFIEQNVKKCAEYFPLEPGTSLDFDGVRVVSKKQDYFPFPIETKVQVRMTYLDVTAIGYPTHSCTHYHWLDWPDRGVPEADLTPIALLSKLKSSQTPIIVHCSAGIGRTGSIVLIQHAMELLHIPSPLLEMREYLLELRKQRNNSIQTEHQYLYVHQVLLNYLNRARYLDDSVQPYLENFTKEYLKATQGF